MCDQHNTRNALPSHIVHNRLRNINLIPFYDNHSQEDWRLPVSTIKKVSLII